MQPYPNANYFNQTPYVSPYNAPMQPNPYMDRLNNLQQFQQSIQQPAPQQVTQHNFLGGKVVDSIDVVKATDIPMDGSIYYFPKADSSEIYTKRWLPNGTTENLTYKPFFETNADISVQNTEKSKFEPFSEFTEVFMKRFDDLENRLDLIANTSTKSSNSRTKKEVESE